MTTNFNKKGTESTLVVGFCLALLILGVMILVETGSENWSLIENQTFSISGNDPTLLTGAVIGVESETSLLEPVQKIGIRQTINSCGTLNDRSTLTNDLLGITETCFIINASNITLFGGGYTITGSGIGFGVNITGFQNVTIRDLNIKNFSQGIYVQNGINITIANNTIYTAELGYSNRGIVFVNVSFSNITDNYINTTANDSIGITMNDSSNQNAIRYNRINTTGLQSHGISQLYINSSVIEFNIINTSNNNSRGVNIQSDFGSNISYNIIFTGGSVARGISVSSLNYPSQNGTIFSNNITTVGTDSPGVNANALENFNFSFNVVTTNGTNSNGFSIAAPTRTTIYVNKINTSVSGSAARGHGEGVTVPASEPPVVPTPAEEKLEAPAIEKEGVPEVVQPQKELPSERTTLAGRAFSFGKLLSQRYGLYGLGILVILLIMGLGWVLTKKKKEVALEIPSQKQIKVILPAPKPIPPGVHYPGFKEVYRQRVQSFKGLLRADRKIDIHKQGFKDIYKPNTTRLQLAPSKQKVFEVHKPGFKEVYRSGAQRGVDPASLPKLMQKPSLINTSFYIIMMAVILALLFAGLIYLFREQLLLALAAIKQLMFSYGVQAFTAGVIGLALIILSITLRKVSSELKIIGNNLLSAIVEKRRTIVTILGIVILLIIGYLRRTIITNLIGAFIVVLKSQWVNIILGIMAVVIIVLIILIMSQLHKSKKENEREREYNPSKSISETKFNPARKQPLDLQLDEINRRLSKSFDVDENLVFTTFQEKITSSNKKKKQVLQKEMKQLEEKMATLARMPQVMSKKKFFSSTEHIQEKLLKKELETVTQRLQGYPQKATILEVPERNAKLDLELAQLEERLASFTSQEMKPPKLRTLTLQRKLPKSDGKKNELPKIPKSRIPRAEIVEIPAKPAKLDKELSKIEENLQRIYDPEFRKVRIIRNVPSTLGHRGIDEPIQRYHYHTSKSKKK